MGGIVKSNIPSDPTAREGIKNFMNKPVTWGDSFKWSGIVLGLYAAVIGACVAYEKWTDYKAEKEMLKKILG